MIYQIEHKKNRNAEVDLLQHFGFFVSNDPLMNVQDEDSCGKSGMGETP